MSNVESSKTALGSEQIHIQGQDALADSTLVLAKDVTAAAMTSNMLPEGWLDRSQYGEELQEDVTTGDAILIRTGGNVVHRGDGTVVVIVDEFEQQMNLIAAGLALVMSEEAVMQVSQLAYQIAKSQNAQGIPTAVQQMIVDQLAMKGVSVKMSNRAGDTIQPAPSAKALADAFEKED